MEREDSKGVVQALSKEVVQNRSVKLRILTYLVAEENKRQKIMFHFTSKLIHFVYFSHSPVAKDEKVEGRRLKAPKEEFERMCISVSGFYSCHDQQHRPGRKQPWLSDGPFSLRPGAVFPLCLRCRGSLPGLTRVMVRPYHFCLLNEYFPPQQYLPSLWLSSFIFYFYF